MKTQFTIKKIAKMSAAVGAAAFVAIAGAAVTAHTAAPRVVPDSATSIAADRIVRLDPVTVTMSRARFDALREQSGDDTSFAGKDADRAVTHG